MRHAFHRGFRFPLFVAMMAGGLLAGPARAARVYYVDDAEGEDSRDGQWAATAWKSLGQVNRAVLQPGDRVLFRRGGVWRGQLRPQSGADGSPVVYGAYGEGARPRLLGSVAMDRQEDWRDEGGSIWSTHFPCTVESVPIDLAAARWQLHAEGGARVTKRVREGAVLLDATTSGSAGNHLQLYLPGFAVDDGATYRFTFRACSTKPFVLDRVSLGKAGAPWTAYGRPHDKGLSMATNWTRHEVSFRSSTTAVDGRITLLLGGSLPADAVFSFEPVSWERIVYAGREPPGVDVGNIIFDGGPMCGVKRWRREELKQPGDYWYSASDDTVKLRAEGNPAGRYRSIELALTRHIIDEGGRHHVTYEDLDLRYGAAHGIGGGATHHITVRRCDLSFIGGGHQHTRPDGRPVRYGNGVEFWEAAHDNLVEGCRIWEVYDAALTNQGSNENEQRNLVYRDNVIWNSEYSFEYWNRPAASVTSDILFERNTCFGAGRGWGHAQRPDPNGRHLMFYQNPARTSRVVVRENLFVDAANSLLRMENDWTAGLTMERNGWFQSRGATVWYRNAAGELAPFDAGSLVGDPQFIDATARDFRLAANSPASRHAADGGPIGSRQRLRD